VAGLAQERALMAEGAKTVLAVGRTKPASLKFKVEIQV
jgi:hypothetical protein